MSKLNYLDIELLLNKVFGEVLDIRRVKGTMDVHLEDYGTIQKSTIETVVGDVNTDLLQRRIQFLKDFNPLKKQLLLYFQYFSLRYDLLDPEIHFGNVIDLEQDGTSILLELFMNANERVKVIEQLDTSYSEDLTLMKDQLIPIASQALSTEEIFILFEKTLMHSDLFWKLTTNSKKELREYMKAIHNLLKTYKQKPKDLQLLDLLRVEIVKMKFILKETFEIIKGKHSSAVIGE